MSSYLFSPPFTQQVAGMIGHVLVIAFDARRWAQVLSLARRPVQLLRGPISTTQWWYGVADFLARFGG